MIFGGSVGGSGVSVSAGGGTDVFVGIIMMDVFVGLIGVLDGGIGVLLGIGVDVFVE